MIENDRKFSRLNLLFALIKLKDNHQIKAPETKKMSNCTSKCLQVLLLKKSDFEV